MNVRLQSIRGRNVLVWLTPSGDPLPVIDTRRCYREVIYRDPMDAQQASDALARVWMRMAARNLIASGSRA